MSPQTETLRGQNDHTWGGIPTRALDREAHTVARLFGFGDAKVQHLRTSENRVWRVRQGSASHVLRCHRPASLHLASLPALRAEQIEAELHYLSRMAGRTSFPLPSAVATPGGAGVVTRVVDETTSLHWTMLRWVSGRQYRRGIRDVHMERAGRMAAELHSINRRMDCQDLPRPCWDANQLHAAVEELRPHRTDGSLSADVWELVIHAERTVVGLMSEGCPKDRSGLIHADLGIQNFVFNGDQVSPIDFCSCGHGCFAFDIAQILLPAPRQSYWDAFGRGYENGGEHVFDEAVIRKFIGMSFILWLNASIPTRFTRIQARLDTVAARTRGFLS